MSQLVVHQRMHRCSYLAPVVLPGPAAKDDVHGRNGPPQHHHTSRAHHCNDPDGNALRGRDGAVQSGTVQRAVCAGGRGRWGGRAAGGSLLLSSMTTALACTRAGTRRNAHACACTRTGTHTHSKARAWDKWAAWDDAKHGRPPKRQRQRYGSRGRAHMVHSSHVPAYLCGPYSMGPGDTHTYMWALCHGPYAMGPMPWGLETHIHWRKTHLLL